MNINPPPLPRKIDFMTRDYLERARQALADVEAATARCRAALYGDWWEPVTG